MYTFSIINKASVHCALLCHVFASSVMCISCVPAIYNCKKCNYCDRNRM